MAAPKIPPNQKGSISECYLSEIMAKTKALITCVVTAQLTSSDNRYPRFAPNIWLKRGKSGVCIKMIKSYNFSIKLYVVAIYKNRLAEAILIDSNSI